MTLREAARKLLDARMRAPTRCVLIGYIVMVKLYDWQGFGALSESGIRKIKRQLRLVGIDIDQIDLGPR